jgi:hypothetical protein
VTNITSKQKSISKSVRKKSKEMDDESNYQNIPHAKQNFRHNPKHNHHEMRDV